MVTKKNIMLLFADVLKATKEDAVAIACAICFLHKQCVDEDEISRILARNDLAEEVRDGLEILGGRAIRVQMPDISVP